MPRDDLYPPLRQDAAWTALGLALIVIVAAWWTWIWWTTRSPRPSGSAVTLVGQPLEELRGDFLDRIDDVGAAHVSGTIDRRNVFQSLSLLVRRFAFEASGFPAHTKSLADLEREHPGVLAQTVQAWYPDEFAEVRAGDVDDGLARARRLVAGWTSEGPPLPPPSLPVRSP